MNTHAHVTPRLHLPTHLPRRKFADNMYTYVKPANPYPTDRQTPKEKEKVNPYPSLGLRFHRRIDSKKKKEQSTHIYPYALPLLNLAG